MRVAYLGNFGPSYSTETHVALELEALGHAVTRLQEGDVPTPDIVGLARGHDLFLWTMTQGLAERGGSLAERGRLVADLREWGVPSAGFHLDRWWGLAREPLIFREPFFRVDHLFTADGGHDAAWAAEGIRHHWSPPAVYHAEAVDTASNGWRGDIIFVGSWRDYGHAEWWPYRRELLDRLRERYGSVFECFPTSEAIRGLALNALYRSARIVVGDSCLVGSVSRYHSDRIPETLGRGGFIIHPRVDGLEELYPDLPTWELGDWNAMFNLIDRYRANPVEREELRRRNAAHTREHHTYLNRMRRVIQVVTGG